MMKSLPAIALSIFFVPSFASAVVVGDRLDSQKSAIAGDVITDSPALDAVLANPFYLSQQAENLPPDLLAGYGYGGDTWEFRRGFGNRLDGRAIFVRNRVRSLHRMRHR